MASQDHESGAGGQASALFAAFLGRIEAGEEVDFEAFRDEHPVEAHELELMHRDWLQLRHVLSRLGFSPSLTARLREEGDAGADVEQAVLAGERPEEAGPAGGRYRVEGRLGRGAQGEVLHVFDESLKRPLAMKVARTGGPQAQLDSRTLARLLEEARVTGQLDHPGIVPIHELGLDARGRVYFTMKLVKGRSLNAIFGLAARGEEGWTLPRVLGTLLRVCEAVAYAHSKGVVHRDLKPDNIMVGKFGEVYVMDWGLARVLDHDDTKDIRLRASVEGVTGTLESVELRSVRRDLDPESPLVTMDGDVVGTPVYMAPEQAAGKLEEIGPTTDVYAVGAILYHALAGRPPFVEEDDEPGKTPIQVLAQLLNGPPRSLARVAPEAPGALVAICDKAMARDREERYATTEEMAEDLRAFLENRVVQAFETGAWAEARTWVRRNRALAASLGVALVLALGGLIAAGLFRRAADRADQEQRKGRLLENAAVATQANLLMQADEAAEGRRVLERAPEDLRSWEWYHLDHWGDQSSLVLRGHLAGLSCLTLAPGAKVAASGAEDGTARLWDLEAGVELLAIDVDSEARSVAFTRDGARLLVGTKDRRLLAFDVGTGALVRDFGELSDEVRAVDTAPDGRVAAACLDGRVTLWKDLGDQDPRILADPRSRLDGISLLRFLDGVGPDQLLTVSRASVKVWNTTTGRSRALFSSATVASANRSGAVVWRSLSDPATFIGTVPEEGQEPEQPKTFQDPTGGEYTIALDERARMIVSGDKYGGMTVYTVGGLFDGNSRNYHISNYRGHEGLITCLLVAPDRSFILSGSVDGTVRLWRRGVRFRNDLNVTDWSILQAQFLDAGRLGLMSSDGRVLLLDAQTAEVLLDAKKAAFLPASQLADQYGMPILDHSPVIFTRDGTGLVIGSPDGRLRLVRVPSGETETIEEGSSRVYSVSLDPTGSRLAAGFGDGTIHLWSWPERKSLGAPIEADASVTALDFTASGERILYGTADGWIHVLDLESRSVVKSWKAYDLPIHALVVAGEDRVVTGSESPVALIWSIEASVSIVGLSTAFVKRSDIVSLDFDPEQQRLVGGTEAGTVVIWETDPDVACRMKPDWRPYPKDLIEKEADLDADQSVRDLTARSRVETLFHKYLFLEDVLAKLEEENLDDDELLLARRYATEMGSLEPSELAEFSWRISEEADRSEGMRRRALRAAEAACEADPSSAWYRVLLGAAQFRLEDPRAEATLRSALGLVLSPRTLPEAWGHVFLSLVLSGAGRAQEAALELDSGLGIAREAGTPIDVDALRDQE